MNKILIFLISVLLSNFSLKGQDNFVGKWTLIHTDDQPEFQNVSLVLDVGMPDRGLLYPARITLSCDSFNGTYQLLLVRKNYRQLAISKNKYPQSEIPFSLGNRTSLINGSFDHSKDLKGKSLLTLNRMLQGDYFEKSKAMTQNQEQKSAIESTIFKFLNSSMINLEKIKNDDWKDTAASLIVQPKLSPAYFGIIDTIYVKSKDAVIKFNPNNDNDIITIKTNSIKVVDQIDSKKKRNDEEIILDTGLNFISFFCEDFGKNPPSTASFSLEFDNFKKKIDFGNKDNNEANFIIAKVYYGVDDNKKNTFEEYNSTYEKVPIPEKYLHADYGNNLLTRTSKNIGNIVTNSQQLRFAIWDDALEDGDSISLCINGSWIKKGFPVKNKAQFFDVTLAPGPNIITFVADNLGSIPPNTSVLEIIDGNKRKSFYIETDMSQNNQVKIFYEIK